MRTQIQRALIFCSAPLDALQALVFGFVGGVLGEIVGGRGPAVLLIGGGGVRRRRRRLLVGLLPLLLDLLLLLFLRRLGHGVTASLALRKIPPSAGIGVLCSSGRDSAGASFGTSPIGSASRTENRPLESTELPLVQRASSGTSPSEWTKNW